MHYGKWLIKKVNELNNLTNDDSELTKLDVDGKVTDEKGGWTVLKVIVLKYMLTVYSTIISQHRADRDIVYLDLLSGSGLNSIRSHAGNQIPFIGSSLIAAKQYSNYFAKMIFVENSRKRRNALEERLSGLRTGKAELLVSEYKDANQIDEILSYIPENSHLFTFIDNEGFDVKWPTIDTILRKRDGEILINYPTTGPKRVLGFGESNLVSNPKQAMRTLSDFYRGKINRNMDDEDFLRKYEKDVSSLRKETTNIQIRSQDNLRYYYHLIYAARRTYGKSPWIESFRNELKPKIESLSGDLVEKVIDIVIGDQKTIEEFHRLDSKQKTSLDDLR